MTGVAGSSRDGKHAHWIYAAHLFERFDRSAASMSCFIASIAACASGLYSSQNKPLVSVVCSFGSHLFARQIARATLSN